MTLDFKCQVQSVPISALKGTNVRQLVEAVLAQAELLELKGDPKGNVSIRVVHRIIFKHWNAGGGGGYRGAGGGRPGKDCHCAAQQRHLEALPVPCLRQELGQG